MTRPRGKKYYRLFSASGKALTAYLRKKSDINQVKKFYSKFKHYKHMKVKTFYSEQNPN